jgi:serine protease
VWVAGGVALIVAGTMSVVLVSTADPGAGLIRWPRPMASGSVDDPTYAEATPAGTTGGDRPSGAVAGSGPEYAASSVVVSLHDPTSTAAITSRGATVVGEIDGTGFLQVRSAGDPVVLVTELQHDPAVELAALDYGRRRTAVPNDSLYATQQQSAFDLMRMPAAWDLLPNASSQVVAVLDTGVDAGHPDLAGRLVPGYNAVAPGSPPSDVDGHGTFVAGVIAANANNGIGIAGITWNGRVMPIKVFNGDVAYDSDIARGVVWAVDHGARVLNMSFGGEATSPLLYAAVRYATDRDVVVVASSGNEGTDAPQYPAAFPEAVAVGAIDAAGKLVDFSSYGAWLDLVAPGFAVASTAPGGTYAIGSGTSYSAPMVAGVAALIRAQNPFMTQAQVAARLWAAARDAGPRGVDPYYGSGVLDAARALGAPFAADMPFPDLGAGEPNDVPERAVPIDYNWNPGVLGAIGVEGDIDWYRYDAVSRMQLSLWLEPPAPFDPAFGQNLSFELAVYDHNLAIIGAMGTDPTSIEVPEGTAFIRVSNRNGAADPRPYKLHFGPGLTGLDYYTETLYGGNAIEPGTQLAAVDIGDVTGDGRADVVVSTEPFYSPNPNDNKIFVLPQQDGEALAAPVWYTPVQTSVPSLTLADVDQDAKLDVVAAGNAGVEWFRQSAGGLASQGLIPAVSGTYQLVTAGDLDADGDTDLVLVPASGELVVLTHGAGSAFTASTIPGSTGTGIDVGIGDVDGDGRADVVSTNGDLQVFHNHVAGWTRTDHVPAPTDAFNDLSSVAVADVTSDGRADVIGTVFYPGGFVDVFRQNPDGSLADPVTYPGGVAQAATVGDINGDGRTDVTVMDRPNARVLRQLPDGSLQSVAGIRSTHADTAGPQNLAVGPLDGDGLADIAYAGDNDLVIIRHRPAPPDRTGMVVRSVSPVEYTTDVALNAVPQVVFGPGADPSTVDGSTVRLVDGRTGATVAASVSFDAGSRTATITPAAPLHPAKPYRIVVDGVRGMLSTSGLPVRSFASTFTTVSGVGPMSPLEDFAVRGQLGSAVSVSAVVPTGELGEVIVRYSAGTTAPASPTAGSAGYRGVDGGIMIGGLTPGQTYSFSVWYRDRSGTLSPSSTATLVGTSLTLTGSDTGPGGTVSVSGTVATSAGPGAGMTVPLVAKCARGTAAGAQVATATGSASGSLSVTFALVAPQCAYRWEITDSTEFMGGASASVRISPEPNRPPGGPPRER